VSTSCSLSARFGVPYIVVALNKTDMVDDEEILEARRGSRVRGLLSSQEFDGRRPSFVFPRSRPSRDPVWAAAVADLMDKVDEFVPGPSAETDKPFLMPPSRTSSLSPGRGTVITGRVERGILPPEQARSRSSASRRVLQKAIVLPSRCSARPSRCARR
jgi:elongation factor Tu